MLLATGTLDWRSLGFVPIGDQSQRAPSRSDTSHAQAAKQIAPGHVQFFAGWGESEIDAGTVTLAAADRLVIVSSKLWVLRISQCRSPRLVTHRCIPLMR